MYLRPRQGRKPSVMNSRRELSDSDSDDSSPPNKKKKTKGGRFVNRQTGKKPLDGVNSSGKGKSLRQNAPHPPAPFLSDEKVDLSDDDNKDADHVNPSTSFGRRGLKKFRCDICGRCCASKQKIAQHMNTHTGARPFKCDQFCYLMINQINLLIDFFNCKLQIAMELMTVSCAIFINQFKHNFCSWSDTLSFS